MEELGCPDGDCSHPPESRQAFWAPLMRFLAPHRGTLPCIRAPFPRAVGHGVCLVAWLGTQQCLAHPCLPPVLLMPPVLLIWESQSRGHA